MWHHDQRLAWEKSLKTQAVLPRMFDCLHSPGGCQVEEGLVSAVWSPGEGRGAASGRRRANNFSTTWRRLIADFLLRVNRHSVSFLQNSAELSKAKVMIHISWLQELRLVGVQGPVHRKMGVCVGRSFCSRSHGLARRGLEEVH